MRGPTVSSNDPKARAARPKIIKCSMCKKSVLVKKCSCMFSWGQRAESIGRENDFGLQIYI